MALRSPPLALTESEITTARASGYLYAVTCLSTQCKQTSKKLLGEVVANDSVPCDYCGSPINLRSDDSRATITKFVKTLTEIEIPKER